MRPLGILAEGAMTAVTQGMAITRETMDLWRVLMRIAVGSSDITPAKGDRRFADPAWSQNPAFHRLSQSYLAFSASLGRLVDALDSDPANWRQAEKARLAVNLLVSSLARLVNPPGNPNASYFAGGKPGADPDAWLGTAEKRTGTWGRVGRTGASGIRAASVLPRSSRAARSTRRWIRPQAVM